MNNKDFTKKYYINRSKSISYKWHAGKENNCLPMWIADMDFKNDEKVINALNNFISFGDYGYSGLPEDYFEVFSNWHKKRNKVNYKKDEIRFVNGAVNAMHQLIYSLTDENDAILINTPLYPPFKASIKRCGRKVIESKLINNNGYFTFNYKDIENKFKNKNIKVLMLCSPHNPIGRVWKKGELEELFELCNKYNVLVISDEVHSDIIMPDQTFIPSLAFKKYRNNIVSIVAASKTFSLAIFSHSHVIIPNKKLRDKFDNYQEKNHLNGVNAFCGLPTYYGYLYGENWLDCVNNVIFENYNYIKEKLGNDLEMSVLEGSYLLFVNIGKYNKCKSAAECLKNECHIMANAGETFGKDYASWVRLNLATSLTNVKKAVKEIRKLIDD